MPAAKRSPLVPYYNSKGITLYSAKYEEVLPKLKAGTFDALITDPPYGNTLLKWDKTISWPFFWSEAQRLCKPKSPIVIFSVGKFTNQLINTNSRYFRYELIWEKTLPVGFLSANQRPLRSHENILIFSYLFRGSTYNPQMVEGKPHDLGKRNHIPKHYAPASPTTKLVHRATNLYHPRSILRFKNRNGKSLHPTQKPLDLMRWLIRTYTNRNDRIIEPFAGSGSTLVAAALDGRTAIGVEQSEEYCEIIARRLEAGY